MRLNNLTSRLKISLLLLVLLCTFAAGKTIYIDDDSSSDFSTIQAAIDYANDSDTVLVAPGIYPGDGNRDINFKGKAITIRSTDPNDPAIIESTIIDCQGQGRGFTFESEEQTDSILEGLTITNGKAMEGGGIFIKNSSPTIRNCTIKNNNNYISTSAPPAFGGGIYILDGSPIIVNCIISNNSAIRHGDGGGIYIQGSRPTISQCSIIGNTAGSGGGLYIQYSSPLISHCTISDNYAIGGGGLHIGGMGGSSDEHAVRLENCRISNNSANSLSGGLYTILCTLQISNCVISGNRLLYGGAGGGLSITSLTIAEIEQCTIVGNKVIQDPPGVNCVGGGIFLQMCDVKIANSIIRQNRATKGAQLAIHAWDGQQSPEEPPINDPTLVTLHHNDYNSEQDQEFYIYGESNLLTLETYDNLDTDPCFADAGFWDPNSTPDDPNDDFWVDGDYHLKSEYGRWNPNTQTWVVDDVTSPCIDAGDPNRPVGDEPFPNGVIINMGAYGGTKEASKSLSDIPMTVNVNDNDNGGQVTLRQGQILAVTLESNPTTGYSWFPVEKQDSILEKFGDSLYFPSEQDDGTVGAGGWEILYFKSINIGQETLELVYRRSWETDIEPIKTFSIDVVVN
jgi:predicted secreted protein